ncbi:MAG: hypothetical protein J6V92_01990 [Bacteroidaceae bacterium]|nr:hypothetical protein [Bacteroidaceae bacterium]
MSKFLRPNKASLTNAQHFAFYEAFMTVMQQAGFTAAKITALQTQLVTAFQEEDRWYMQARNNELIAQRDAADRRRDNFYGRLHAIVRAWAESGDPDKDAAASTLIKVFQLYKLKTSAQMEEETGVMENLKTDLSTTENLAHIATLGATWIFQQMCTAHEEVKSIRLQEGAGKSEQVKGALVAARKACDALYDELTYLIEAFEKTADTPAPYEDFIRQWNGTLKIYQDMLDRKSGGSTGGTANPDGSGVSSGGQQTTDNGQQSGGGQQTGGDSGGNSGGNSGGGNSGGNSGGGGNDPVPGGDE